MFDKRFDRFILLMTGGIRIDRRDSLRLVAKKFQTTECELRALNNLDEQDTLVPGQQLLVNQDGTTYTVSDSSPKKGIKKALKYLNAGSSIIVYPEGTRNYHDDPTELLPFQAGYANWAKETGALVVPIAQTGDFVPYNPKPNIILNFREPFSINDTMSIDECHQILHEKLVSGIQENLEYTSQLEQGCIPGNLTTM